VALARVLRAWIASGVMTSGGAPFCLRSCLRFGGPAPITARRVAVEVGRAGTPLTMVGSRWHQAVTECLKLGCLCVSSGSSCLWYTLSLMAHGGGMHSMARPYLGEESSVASFK
jgi:hypothetical protein